jgi:hypothetical protein
MIERSGTAPGEIRRDRRDRVAVGTPVAQRPAHDRVRGLSPNSLSLISAARSSSTERSEIAPLGSPFVNVNEVQQKGPSA